MKALVADSLNEKGIEKLQKVCDVVVDTSITPEELLETINEYDAILVRSRTKVTKEVIEKAENLKIIARAGVGVDNIDVAAATEKGIMVVNAPESTTITVAEHTMGLILSAIRKIAVADESTKAGKWEKKRFMGMELKGKTLGVIGMGRIGSQVVKRCQAFEMDAIAYDPYLPPHVAEDMGVKLYEEQDDVLKRADIITIHVPLTEETRHSISTEEFKIMKDTALIFNAARGGVIDEDALYVALKEGEISGAGLDVYEEEPAKENKLFELDNIVCTPHIAASTKEAQAAAAVIVANEVIDCFEGNTPNNIINMPRIDTSGFSQTTEYLEVCEKLGSFLTQYVKKNPIKELNITYKGEITKLQNKELFKRTILQGVLNPITESPVSAVNATSVAESRGITIKEAEAEESEGYETLIEVKAITEKGVSSVEGTFLHEVTITKINGYKVDVKPEGYMFIAKYKDIPGSIGAVGTIFGEENINIGIMQVGRDITGGEAIMVLTLDTEATSDVTEKVKDLDHVKDATGINLL